MDRKEFGKLVAALREEHIDFSPQGMGLWTQNKLAAEANLPEKTISQIEQGRKRNLDAQTLTQLSKALKLTSGERSALFTTSAEVGIEAGHTGRMPAAQAYATLTGLIAEIRLPAFVCDDYTNILVGNSIAIDILNIPKSMIASAPQMASGFNLLRVVFAPESSFRQLMGGYWTERAEASVQFFRAATLPYRHTRRFRTILAELSAYPSFRELWFAMQEESADDILAAPQNNPQSYRPSWTTYSYSHPRLGEISFIAHISITPTEQGSLYLITYLPCTKETAELFERLIQAQGRQVHRFIEWPYNEAT